MEEGTPGCEAARRKTRKSGIRHQRALRDPRRGLVTGAAPSRPTAGSYNLVANRFALGMICQGSQPVAVVAGQTTNVTVAMDCTAIPP